MWFNKYWKYILLWPIIFSTSFILKKRDIGPDILDAIKEVFNSYIVPKNFNVLINSDFKHLQRVEYVQKILDEILHSFNVPVMIVSDIETNSNIHLKIYFAENDHDVIKINRNLHRGQVRRIDLKYLIILLQRGTSNEIQLTLKKIFRYAFEVYIADINVIIDGTGPIEMYTYYPYREDFCDSVKPILVTNFSNSVQNIISNNDIFPQKFRNFHGCPLKVVTWQMLPFVIYDSASIGLEHFKGLDIELLKAFAQKLNFKLDIHKNKPLDLLGGNIYDNGTITGAYKQILERDANITIGCSSCMSKRLELFSSISPYFQMQFIIVVKSRGTFSSLEMLIFPFDIYTWYLLTITTITRYILIYIFKCYRKLQNPFPRLTLSIWLIFLFILRISFEGSFFKLLHNAPLKPLPTTLSEIVAQKYTIITDHAKYRMLKDLSILLPMTRIIQGEPVDAIKALENAPIMTGVYTSKIFFAYYLKKNPNKRQEFFVVKEPVMEGMLCMYFPQFSFIVASFEKQLIHLRTVGFINHFFKSYEIKNLPVTSKVFLKHKNNNVFPINLDMVQGIFYCLFFSNLLAVFILLLEIFCVKYLWLKNVLRKL